MSDVLVIVLAVLLSTAGVVSAVYRAFTAVALCLIGLVLLLAPLSSTIR